MMQTLRSDIIINAASPARRKGERRHPAASSIYEPTTGLIMAKRLTTEDFISRAKQKHGDKYIYDKCEYVNAKTKVIITCKEHGDFTTIPASHLRGHDCLLCSTDRASKSRALDTETFIMRARKVHGDRYSYKNTNYISADDKVEIICSDHGSFYQRAAGHLSGKGCSACAVISKAASMSVTEDYFIAKSISRHGYKYDYTQSFPLIKKKAKISCPAHGVFMQSPLAHMRGQGCPECSIEKSRSTLHSFIESARMVHGTSYIYEKAKYVNSITKVVITCKIHGDFLQQPNRHLSGRGCPGCAKTGFDKNKDGFVYFLMGNGAVKVGITNKPKQRLRQLKSETPFEFSVFSIIRMSGREAIDREKYYHKKYERIGFIGFNGCTEWLKYSKELMEEITYETSKNKRKDNCTAAHIAEPDRPVGSCISPVEDG